MAPLRGFPNSAVAEKSYMVFETVAFWVLLLAQTLALSGGRALEWGLWAACCKLLGGSMGQLLIRVEVMRMAPTLQSQRQRTDFHHVGLGSKKTGRICFTNAEA